MQHATCDVHIGRVVTQYCSRMSELVCQRHPSGIFHALPHSRRAEAPGGPQGTQSRAGRRAGGRARTDIEQALGCTAKFDLRRVRQRHARRVDELADVHRALQQRGMLYVARSTPMSAAPHRLCMPSRSSTAQRSGACASSVAMCVSVTSPPALPLSSAAPPCCRARLRLLAAEVTRQRSDAW